MTNKPTQFSIIIPTYNEARYLPRLLTDLTHQTHPHFNIIIVDGNSQDDTLNQVVGFKERLPNLNIVNSPLSNAAHQRNLGAKQAASPWLIFMDADNRLPHHFLHQLAHAVNIHNPDIFTTLCYTDSKTLFDRFVIRLINTYVTTVAMLGSPGALGSLIGCQRSIFLKHKGFDPDIVVTHDGELVRRLHRQGYSFKVFRQPRFRYSLRRIHQLGKIRSIRTYLHLFAREAFKRSVAPEEYPMGGTNYK